ncbi:hypothetical protein C2845_PM11G17070 [Panicum miliaceum]|uniref:Uncharacterized protein n=1 Tax=Panicum miliaceum TaxID=4540 RepID=A0A3L6RSK7_PANMI|nr:hypothetical protein C2845_PM11G17070 [Panicum miliaceum]
MPVPKAEHASPDAGSQGCSSLPRRQFPTTPTPSPPSVPMGSRRPPQMPKATVGDEAWPCHPQRHCP